MTPEQRAVLVDAMREMGCDAEVRAFEDPMLLEKLAALEGMREVVTTGEEGCPGCGEGPWASDSHRKECPFLPLWRLTNDPRYDEYFQMCWEAAHAEQARRMGPRRRSDAQRNSVPPEPSIYNDVLRTLWPQERIEGLVYGGPSALFQFDPNAPSNLGNPQTHDASLLTSEHFIDAMRYAAQAARANPPLILNPADYANLTETQQLLRCTGKTTAVQETIEREVEAQYAYLEKQVEMMRSAVKDAVDDARAVDNRDGLKVDDP